MRVVVDSTHCGPPTSGNGGYTAGLLAGFVDGPAEVTLRRPPPLDTELDVVTGPDGAQLEHEGTLVAEAVRTTIELPDPPQVDAAVAAGASAASMFRDPGRHPFPTCFACGPDRAEGDGLRIFAGPVAGSEAFAAPWTPTAVDRPTVWAALDCPSSAPAFYDPTAGGPFVLGRIAARIDRLPEVGVPHVVTSLGLGRDGRKFFALSAIRGPDGTLCAVARATWIELT